MFNKYFLTICSMIVLLAVSCQEKKEPQESHNVQTVKPTQPNMYITKYSGSYIVEVNGVPNSYETEGYALKDDGTATWLWIESDGNNGAKVKQKKYGTWMGEKDKISISIQSQSGIIEEVYFDKNEGYINKDNPNRKLKKGPY